MGSRNSKLDGQATGMFRGWMTPRAVFLSHRRQPQPPTNITKDVVQILQPLKIPDAPMLYENDSNVKDHEGTVVDKMDNIIRVDIQGEREKDEEESEEEGYERKDMILRSQSTSPSFRVYCLDTCQSDYDDKVVNYHDCNASVNTDLTKATTTLTRQSSHNSNDEGPVKIPRRRWRRRRLGVGKKLLHLKLPHLRRSISTGSIADKSGSRYHFQMPRISHLKSIGRIKHHNDHQHPTVDERSTHHQLSLLDVDSHQNIIDYDNDHHHQNPHTSEGNQDNDNNHSHDDSNLMKSPHISHHSSNDDDNNDHRTSDIVESNTNHDFKSHGGDNDDNNPYICDVGDNNSQDQDQDQHKHHNHHRKLSCIYHQGKSVHEDDKINHNQSQTHLKHELPHISFWNKARHQVRGERTGHHG